jgi:regulator of RNase E activity RraA
MPGSCLPRLAALDSCACSDAMDQLGISGVAPGLRALTVARRVTGPVITVELGIAGNGAPGGRHLGTAAVEAAGPGDVIVVAAGGRAGAAGWGGVVFLPAARAAEVIARAEVIAAWEAAAADRIRAGEPASRVLSAAYEEMLAAAGDAAGGGTRCQ